MGLSFCPDCGRPYKIVAVKNILSLPVAVEVRDECGRTSIMNGFATTVGVKPRKRFEVEFCTCEPPREQAL